MDAVSDILRFVRLNGAVYLNGEFTAPWCVIGQPDTALWSAFLPQSERVASYHMIIEGSCWVRLADDPGTTIHLDAGELLVVPQGAEHILGSALELPPATPGPLLASQLEKAPGQVMKLSHGGGGVPTRLVCGFLACDDTQNNPLLSSLPRLFKVDMRNDPRSTWLESSLQFAAAEAAEYRAGSAIVLARLSELLFVEAVRRCIEALPADRKGWLAGVRDRFVGRALSMLHAQPEHSWTVEELARKVGLSRSALAQRFTELLGQPPMQYLAQWRLQIAAQELRIGSKSLAAIAEQIGYDSEAAFNRAFRREFGMPPACWRKTRGTTDMAGAPANAVGPAGETTAAP
ncbi:AraC family transcriptional regulator [Paraburkholderia sp. BL10I2N1]|uniref:AraC family transcriptional regulator n=1 Tax=Paraburkholderia sp. BL10I2N1 TaxID=1938796 RepID=UPI00105B825C|nr:AraC family transcriptional regulator [Paraburkholderia sp. BL10I2N1]TDN58880.1 AraC-like DNA-binding protein [Paraburkholderia sp. BL10I2N1]